MALRGQVAIVTGAGAGIGRVPAIDLKNYGVTVTNVLPGPILTAPRRSSEPNEDPNLLIEPGAVAEATVFLASRTVDVIMPEVSIYPRASSSG